MKIDVVTGDVTQIQSDALVVNYFEAAGQPGGATAAVDRALGGEISQLIAAGEIKGKLDEMTLIHTFGKIPAARVLVVGLGKQEDLKPDRVRNLMGNAGRYLRRSGVRRIASIVHGAGKGGLDPKVAAGAIAEGFVLGLYTFQAYKTQEPEYPGIDEVVLVEGDEGRVQPVKAGAEKGRIEAEATNLARDMANTPSNHMTPADMAECAEQVAKTYGLQLTVLEREQMEAMGMGALLGVAQGSARPPRLIVLRYEGAASEQARGLGLVGKGITFDSGGISIKPSEGLEEMKGDMAGGAAVIAAMQAIAQLKPKINVTGIVPATENMPSGSAYKPGDVLRAMSGKTIEVISTDAEGRLVLSDALAYARQLGLSPLVDVATLTGACSVALGPVCSGVFGNDQSLVDRLIKAGEEGGECNWQLPTYDQYKDLIKSDVADLKNTGGRAGGAITAALFLAAFVGNTPWAHLDIAGTSRTDKDKGFLVKGATGVGTRTLINLALSMEKE